MHRSVTFARRLSAAALSLIAVCALAARPAEASLAGKCPASLDIPTSAAGADQAADAIVCLVNAERRSRGLKPLRRDGDLAQAAAGHASDMVRRDYFSHVSLGGKNLGDRVRAAGYGNPGDVWKAGEDLGWGT